MQVGIWTVGAAADLGDENDFTDENSQAVRNGTEAIKVETGGVCESRPCTAVSYKGDAALCSVRQGHATNARPVDLAVADSERGGAQNASKSPETAEYWQLTGLNRPSKPWNQRIVPHHCAPSKNTRLPLTVSPSLSMSDQISPFLSQQYAGPLTDSEASFPWLLSKIDGLHTH
ncbi:hypothetical protein BCV70DRAFT_205239 [Testicularia cyperi]|uniref:Uncharacterized protein n=1 Tax=Testicularia cyperi TaxID=1882483 RepID=A0A317XSY5_9BASI|nr:hypothetical protein BCV70DRAFT_205239 [Testicularia cyperi]